jgi:hypothetical protein
MKKSETNKDVEAIKQAVLDYVEGAYTVDPARIERSVHPKLAKLGFIRVPIIALNVMRHSGTIQTNNTF